MSRKPDVYERLARAIAPSIYENMDVKKGILLQLFGGTKKDFTQAGRGHFRLELCPCQFVYPFTKICASCLYNLNYRYIQRKQHYLKCIIGWSDVTNR